MKIGDRVSVISDTIKGKVIELKNDQVLIEDEDGFKRSYIQTELVVVEGDYKLSEQKLSKEISEKIKIQLDESLELKSYEIDLHIEELVDNHSNMTNHEILMKQMSVCKSFIQKAIGKGTKRIVLIHGKGEGVLKAEIHLFLNKLRDLNGVSLEYHDASYQVYGMGGATEVIFN